MRIGIDIDDVVVKFMKRFLEFYNEKYKKEVSLESLDSYDLLKPLELNEQEATQHVLEFYGSDHFDTLEIIEESLEAIQELSKNHELFFITSRPEKLKERTNSFLQKTFPDLSYELIFSREFYDGRVTKSKICRDKNIKIMIEDHGDFALDCANNGIKTFLLNKPWNRRHEDHPKLIRVEGWKEILEKIENGYRTTL